MRPPFPQAQPDEGYSEESGSHVSDSEMTLEDSETTANSEQRLDTQVKKIAEWILALPLQKRKDIVDMVIPSLPCDQKEVLRQWIDTLTHFDPTIFLPAELVLNIFSYLTPSDLVNASRISRAWRERARDERLWRLCFAREGWLLDNKKVAAFQDAADRVGKPAAERLLKLNPPALDMQRRASRKRGRDEAFSEGDVDFANAGVVAAGASTTLAHHRRDGESYASMEGLQGAAILEPFDVHDHPVSELFDSTTDGDRSFQRRTSTTSSGKTAWEHHVVPSTAGDFHAAPSPFQPGSETKLSWPYLYKQRRRLEANWDKGAYHMFQLPHPDHLNEGHEECVYTVQHAARHLVSGSRDKTIRVWDLNTCRLRGEPLRGHEASVLCLQFDERPEQDIIVSGGSDAFVIIWKFSTGEIIKKMTHAHGESVLNLRFDERYIVTCSKDKTIKVWNRNALALDSDLIPSHVLQNFVNDPSIGDVIAEYSLLTTLSGHAAAVNAVMVHENTIVSASGDRTIKSWDLDAGQFRKNYVGHTKGIACVQFDGRRIVSGSSDNTVRIFDAEQQAEIACLSGHSNLVRTVQARFGDLLTITNEELAEEARQADIGFMRAMENGLEPASVSRRSTLRNAGSSRPDQMLALGTKIPPGGGGSRWAKIVSGSYDETVILWKKDWEGKWVQKYASPLRQDDLLQRTRRRSRRRNATANDQTTNVYNAQPHPNTTGPAGGQPGPTNTVNQGQTLAQAHAHHHIAHAQGHLIHANALMQNQNQPNQPQAGQGHQLLPTSQMAALASAQNQLGQHLGHQQLTAPTQRNADQLHQQPQQQVNASVIGAVIPQAPPQQAQTVQTPVVPAGPNPPQPQQAPPANGDRQRQESNRVFKLQFDARRIVCCSQNKVIVGWDFANGDPELEKIGEWSVETA